MDSFQSIGSITSWYVDNPGHFLEVVKPGSFTDADMVSLYSHTQGDSDVISSYLRQLLCYFRHDVSLQMQVCKVSVVVTSLSLLSKTVIIRTFSETN